MNTRCALKALCVLAVFALSADSAFAFVDNDGEPATPFFRFLGRLHAVVVHFPIALICMAAFLEAWGLLRKKAPSPTALVLIRWGALFALIAAWFGWINGDNETHGRAVEDTLFWHRWVGVASWALASIAALASWSLAREWGKRLYHGALFLAVGTVCAAGHFGGELVYGEGYAFEVFEERSTPAPDDPKEEEPNAENTPEETAPEPSLFASRIQPILEANCTRCHGSDKGKGKLRLHTREEAFKGDRATWLIVPGFPDSSELFRRVTLPHDDFDLMPPEGEGDPLSAEDIASLREWITAGAEWPE